jgi:hypothetical protein
MFPILLNIRQSLANIGDLDVDIVDIKGVIIAMTQSLGKMIFYHRDVCTEMQMSGTAREESRNVKQRAHIAVSALLWSWGVIS